MTTDSPAAIGWNTWRVNCFGVKLCLLLRELLRVGIMKVGGQPGFKHVSSLFGKWKVWEILFGRACGKMGQWFLYPRSFEGWWLFAATLGHQTATSYQRILWEKHGEPEVECQYHFTGVGVHGTKWPALSYDRSCPWTSQETLYQVKEFI